MAISWVAHAGFDEGVSAANSGDFRKAFEEWLPLAEQGDANAQFNLGLMYKNGQGVPQDYKKAVVWFRQAAGQGNASAQFGLGTMYYIGQGVPQDYKEAVVWYRQAAEQGNAKAQNILGAMYEYGGVCHRCVWLHMRSTTCQRPTILPAPTWRRTIASGWLN